jgi:hypothetical protein
VSWFHSRRQAVLSQESSLRDARAEQSRAEQSRAEQSRAVLHCDGLLRLFFRSHILEQLVRLGLAKSPMARAPSGGCTALRAMDFRIRFHPSAHRRGRCLQNHPVGCPEGTATFSGCDCSIGAHRVSCTSAHDHCYAVRGISRGRTKTHMLRLQTTHCDAWVDSSRAISENLPSGKRGL